MQSAADRADGDIQDLGHRFVFLAVDVFEHQNRPVFRRQAIQGALNSAFKLRLFQSMFRPAELGRIQRLAGAVFGPPAPEGIDDPLLSFQADGRIDSDAVQPGEKLGVALEAAQRLVRVKESVLHHVLGVFRVINQPVDGIKETVLIATNQFTEGCRSPLQTVSDESMIVRVHGFLPLLDASGGTKVPWRTCRS